MTDDKTRSQILNIPSIKLIKQIGEGGMSTVWKAWDTINQRIVAVKILNHDHATEKDEVRAFHHEEEMLRTFHHPGIVQAYELNSGNGNWYIVMEYVDGYSFADLLQRKQHLCEEDCILICESVASALDYAWNDHGIVHCDIKPENIMINSEGVVKLMDLGISYRYRLSAPTKRARPDHILGTPAYMSPEQIYSDVQLDCRADIYSLAATLYHLSTGRVLYPHLDMEETMRAQCDVNRQARDPRHYRPQLSEGFAQLLEAMLVKDRNYRITDWKTVIELCQCLESGRKFKPRKNPSKSSILLED